MGEVREKGITLSICKHKRKGQHLNHKVVWWNVARILGNCRKRKVAAQSKAIRQMNDRQKQKNHV